MDKICLIYQPCGGGDCLFLLKLARHFYEKGYKIIWPVVFEYANFQKYFTWINWISWDDQEHKLTHKDKLPDHVQFPYKDRYDPYAPNFVSEEFVFVNGFLNPGGAPVMAFKYSNWGIDYKDWANYVIWERNIEKENSLFYDVLHLTDYQDYVLVNRHYQMRPCVLFYDGISNDPRNYNENIVIDMKIVEGFSIFDWAKVIRQSLGIYSIETSLCYILESPELRDFVKKKDLHLWSRHGNFSQVDYLFNLPWNYHR